MAKVQAGIEIVVFDIGRQRFGLAVDHVDRVLRAVALTPVPNAPAIVEGLINIAGTPLAALDLRKRFGLRAKPVDASDVLVVARAGGRKVAIRADRAMGVVKVGPAEVSDPRTILAGDVPIAGVAVLQDGLVLVQDPEAFLTQSEALELDRVMAPEAAAP